MPTVNVENKLNAAIAQRSMVAGSLAALVFVFGALSIEGDSAAKCPSNSEKLYTPNEPQIKAQIRKLEAFQSVIRSTLTDMKQLQTESANNHFWGKVAEWRTYAGESGAALCSAVGIANERLATPCKTAQAVVALVNDINACREGEGTGCVGIAISVASNLTKKNAKKIDDKVEKLGGNETGANSDPRYFWNEDLQEAKGRARKNELTQFGVEKASELNSLGKGGTDALTEACKKMRGVPLNTLVPGKQLGQGEIDAGCDIAGNVLTIVETRKVGQELSAAYTENEDRQAKLIQQLEVKIASVSQPLAQLRSEVYSIDWPSLAVPEPNKTTIKQDECEGTPVLANQKSATPKVTLSEEERRRALSQLTRPNSMDPSRSTGYRGSSDAEASSLNGESAAAMIQGIAEAVAAGAANQNQKNRPSSSNVPSAVGKKGMDCPANTQGWECLRATENVGRVAPR